MCASVSMYDGKRKLSVDEDGGYLFIIIRGRRIFR